MIYILKIFDVPFADQLNAALGRLMGDTVPLLAKTYHPETNQPGFMLSDEPAWRIPSNADPTEACAILTTKIGPAFSAAWGESIIAGRGAFRSLRELTPAAFAPDILDEASARAEGWYPKPDIPDGTPAPV